MQLTNSGDNVLSSTPNLVKKSIRACAYHELTDLKIINEKKQCIGVWPKANKLFPPDLLKQLGDAVCQEQMVALEQEAHILLESTSGQAELEKSCCPTMSIPLTQDRSLITVVIPNNQNKPHEIVQHLEDYVKKPELVFQLGVSSLSVQCINLNSVYLAYSDELERDYSHDTEPLPWLQTQTDIYKNLVNPYLYFVKVLHDRKLTHGDLTSSNVVLSQQFQKLIFIDFKHIGDIPYPNEGQKNVTAYQTWQISRLVDLRDMCDSVIWHATRCNQAFTQHDRVMLYFDQVAQSLSDIYLPNEDKDESIEDIFLRAQNCLSINIDTLILEVDRLIHLTDTKKMKRTLDNYTDRTTPKKTRFNTNNPTSDTDSDVKSNSDTSSLDPPLN